MEHINSFQSGMNQDLTKPLIKPTQYYLAENMSLVTEEGLTTAGLRNIKGNNLAVQIPDCSNVVEVLANATPITNGNVTVVGQVLAIVSDGTPEDFFDQLQTQIYATFGNTVRTVIDGDRILIFSGLDASNVLFANTVVVTSLIPELTISDVVPAQTGLHIMGWKKIRDSIYIFTTNELLATQPSGTSGQIWRLLYDKVSYNFNLFLIYNNIVDFSLQNPIAELSQAVGNFENEDIQKLYWTDNYNRPRFLNVADPDAMAIPVDNLEFAANLSFVEPVLQEVLQGSGSLRTGIHQVAYRLKNTSGTTSPFISASRLTHIVTEPETNTNRYVSHVGDAPGTITGKALRYLITGLDTDFDRIEVLSIYWEVLDEVPEIKIILDEPIPSTGDYEFIYSGSTEISDFSLDQLREEDVVLRRVKTLAAKNNLLFAGNVTIEEFDVEFDARAYRFVSDNSASWIDADHTIVHDTLGNPTTVDVSVPFDLPEDHDAINPNDDPDSWDNYLFADGVTFGGRGPLVSYLFVHDPQYSVTLDSTLQFSPSPGAGVPYINITKTTDTYDFDTGVTFDNVNTYKNFHSPYITGILKGFRRDEKYRIGIVFFSKKGQHSFVKWIGDIRIPHVWMPDYADPTPTVRTVQYPLATVSGNTVTGYPVGLEITVDCRTIIDQISGYKIVYVKRTVENQTILGQGVFYNGNYDSNSGRTGLVPNESGIDTTVAFNTVSGDIASFNCPEFLFGESPGFLANDMIDIVDCLDSNDIDTLSDINNNNLGLFKRGFKNYSTNNACSPIQDTVNSLNPYVLTDTLDVDSANTAGSSTIQYVVGGVSLIFNESNDLGSPGDYRAYGSKTLILRSTEFSNFENTVGDDFMNIDGVDVTDFNLYIANYKRPLAAQYGGSTHAARSQNTYIDTGHYVSTTITPSLNNFFSTTVFGGDTFICAWDNVKSFPNHYDVAYADGFFVGKICPIETGINIDLRRGDPNTAGDPRVRVFNKERLNGDYLGSHIDTDEYYILEDVYSQQNESFEYFPRPINLLSTNDHDVRIWHSQRKANSETVDSWTIFKPDDFIDVDTIQGPIYNLITHQNKLVCFQSTGVSLVGVEDRSLMQDNSGAELVLGEGGILNRYDYISRIVGSQHQHSFAQSSDSIFFFDINTRSIYKLGDNLSSLSTIKGMSSYLYNNITGFIHSYDNPYIHMGVTSTYDFKQHEAWFTFRDLQPAIDTLYTTYNDDFAAGTYSVTITLDAPDAISADAFVVQYYTREGTLVTEQATFVSYDNVTDIITLENSESQIEDIAPDQRVLVFALNQESFTLAYNDFANEGKGAFTSFYSFTPPVYLSDLHNVLSVFENPAGSEIWIHSRNTPFNDYNSFYGVFEPSKVRFLVNPYPMDIKVFDNYQMDTEVYNESDVNQAPDTFTQIRLFNEHQNTDFRDLNTSILKRAERMWNISGLRNRVLYTTASPDIFTDISPTEKLFGERMRDKWLFVDLIFDNSDDDTLIVFNSFKTHYRKSFR